MDGGGDGLARDLAVLLECLYELEVLDERVVLTGDFAGNDGGIGRGLLVVEHIAGAARAALDTVESPHEVEVPIAAAELTIGDYVQAGGLLFGYEVADGNVFDGLERGVIDDACGMVGASLLEHVGAQKASDDVVAKRCVMGSGHWGPLSGLIGKPEYGSSFCHRELLRIYRCI